MNEHSESHNNKVMIVYPQPKKRFLGGIYHVVNGFKNYVSGTNYSKFVYLNSLPKEGRSQNMGKISLDNIHNAYLLTKKLIKEINSQNVELIIFNSSYGNALMKDLVISLIAKLFTSSKVVVHIHFVDELAILGKRNSLHFFFKSFLLNRLDGAILLSSELRQMFEKNQILIEKKWVLYNYYNFELNNLNRPINEITNLLFLGALSHRKGIVDLIKALKLVKENYHLCIGGEFKDDLVRDEVKEFLNNNSDIKSKITFLGYITGDIKINALEMADVLILPSYAEGFPLVLLEGAATNNAIICTDVGSVSEVFKEYENCLYFSKGDKGELSSKIDELIINTDLRRKLQKNNLKLSKMFTLENYVNNFEGIIKNILD